METVDQSDSDLPSDKPTGAMPVEPEILPSVVADAAPFPALPAPLGNDPVSHDIEALPAILHRSGANARFAAHECFLGAIRNERTRRAYMHAVKLFLAWAEKNGRSELVDIAPWDVGAYMGELAKTTSIATRNQHLSGLRHFFDAMVTRHAIVLNPALSVRGERYAAIEGRTPEISIAQARALLSSLDTTHVYAETDLDMKAKALGMCEQSQPSGRKRWRDNPDLLTFLAQL